MDDYTKYLIKELKADNGNLFDTIMAIMDVIYIAYDEDRITKQVYLQTQKAFLDNIHKPKNTT